MIFHRVEASDVADQNVVRRDSKLRAQAESRFPLRLERFRVNAVVDDHALVRREAFGEVKGAAPFGVEDDEVCEARAEALKTKVETREPVVVLEVYARGAHSPDDRHAGKERHKKERQQVGLDQKGM